MSKLNVDAYASRSLSGRTPTACKEAPRACVTLVVRQELFHLVAHKLDDFGVLPAYVDYHTVVVTQSGGRRMPAAAPAFSLMVIVTLGYLAASPVESLWKFE